MICGVHGCPGCNLTVPISPNAEPAGDAFAVASRLSGCAQLAAATEIAAMANEQRTGLIIFCFVADPTPRALLFHGRELKSVRDGALPTHGATFLCRFVGGFGSNSFACRRQIPFFEIYPEGDLVRER
jgi:hypothetical protein